VNRKIREARILKRAREIAATGKHIGWYYVEAELRFQMGEPLARQVLSDQQIREELDRICTEARKLRRQCGALQPDSEAAAGATEAHPKRRRLNTDQKRALKSAGLQVFVQQYARKAQRNMEPNDRSYDRKVEKDVKRMKPEVLDRLLRDDEE
jgi:hypothetical protein